MTWNLFLDDLRDPSYVSQVDSQDWVVARSSDEAKRAVVGRGMPAYMSLDHDLGGEDTAMIFLKWLAFEFWDGFEVVPQYSVHSQNPVGAENIRSFMDSWRRSCEL